MQPKDAQLDWQKYIQVYNNQDKFHDEENNSKDALQALPKEKKRLRSNKTHYSPADPDARIAKKKGKPCRLYHLSSLSVPGTRLILSDM